MNSLTWPDQWWLYLGGPIRVAFIALAAWAVRGVGVLVFGLLSIAGQLLGSVILDLAAPAEGITFGWPQWLALGDRTSDADRHEPGRQKPARRAAERTRASRGIAGAPADERGA